MARSSARSHSPAARGRAVAALVLLFGAFAPSCAGLVSIEGRSCPCADGWVCCEATQDCQRPGESCEAGSGGTGAQAGHGGSSGAQGGDATGGKGGVSGGSGVSGASSGSGGDAGMGDGGTSSKGGRAGEGGAGASGEAGMGGEPEPEWHSVGPALLDEPVTTSEADFELAPDGTPYLAFRGCEDCDLPSPTHVPVVERFDGRRWTTLPSDGLPVTIVGVPALAVDPNGTVYVLVDGAVRAFDGDVWQPLPDLPDSACPDPNFQAIEDQPGILWATLCDDARQEISVVGFAGSSWESVGNTLPGRNAGVRLLASGSSPYLGHTASDGAHVFVRRLNVFAEAFPPPEWVGDELEGELVELAQAPDSTLYAAVWKSTDAFKINGDVTLYEGAVGGLVVSGALRTSWAPPGLAVSAAGTLYAFYLSDGFVNVNRFDGTNFRDVKSTDIGTATTWPVLRLLEGSGGVVPMVAFEAGAALRVKKYE